MTITTSAKTIETLRSWFAVLGLPETLVSDNGPQFTSEEMEVFLSKNGVKHVLVPPYHPSLKWGSRENCSNSEKSIAEVFSE